ncbi:NUDIX domain-containing protein [Burkholderia sp. 572]|uniref:NUDIX domain-containing protein n=1 Tax=Burkholderia sp. 572 TaxID=3156414 RepID=UPI0033917F5E
MLAGCCPAAVRIAANRRSTPRVARRELLEETGLVCRHLRGLFSAAGRHKFHHVFVSDIDGGAIAHPAHEIARCAWIDRHTVASINCSRLAQACVCDARS